MYCNGYIISTGGLSKEDELLYFNITLSNIQYIQLCYFKGGRSFCCRVLLNGTVVVDQDPSTAIANNDYYQFNFTIRL